LAGKAAFDAPSLMQICAMILESKPAPLERFAPAIAPGLERVVARCLEKDPAARFQNVADLAVALRPFAPEHARILAQRCSYVLNSAARAKLDSVEPDLAPASSNGSGGGLAVSIAPKAAVVDDAQEVSFRPVFRWKRAVFPAMAVGMLAGWFVVRRSSDAETLRTRETGSERRLSPIVTAAPPPASPVVEVPVAVHPTPTVLAPIPTASTEPPRPVRPSGDRPRSERRNTNHATPAKSGSTKEKAEPTTPSHTPTDSEPDVGF
jgi:serine/threonine-protein kinase